MSFSVITLKTDTLPFFLENAGTMQTEKQTVKHNQLSLPLMSDHSNTKGRKVILNYVSDIPLEETFLSLRYLAESTTYNITNACPYEIEVSSF